ncbi:hypothetical protein [Marinobacterium aestuariivivens]|uniref:ABC transporter ATP-binding protein n=1 Tax=Marinobacterium aestuariivivens TaxID=1698799 RepID=A0ABW1ZYJ4_9GAMM
MIELINVSKGYGDSWAVQDLSLTIEPGSSACWSAPPAAASPPP